ncbi:hypothetical protein GGTG_00932 [Gaeumannomyces tritici R3-111a-1]|uniref:Uncharacterized protein n=1 Tax=Gaeumannomyces tritici (strain R3-111a-1) TaxID=644352 RepID=J3NI49_GAET3|nr:hypothetical protein GGTG_00932 [Gaeumannomyces tritici R3-111a-1]EJT80942.1 hypothetical protein GGTG_00932 [Gaeumannomyces tritici R3-111a-1]
MLFPPRADGVCACAVPSRMTAQEDSAVLDVLVRMHIEKLVDFSRALASPRGCPKPHRLEQGCFGPAVSSIKMASIDNLFQAGI